MESARQVLGARYAALGVLDVTGAGLAEFVTAGLSTEEEAAIGDPPRGLGLLGAIIHDPQTLRLEHMTDDPRSVGFPPHHPSMDSFLGVPIVIHGEVFGNLYLTDKIGGPFTAEDEHVVHSFALQAAGAVENVRRYEGERQRANMLENTREIERAIRTASDTQQVLDVLCSMLGEGFGVDRVIAKVGDADHNLLLGAQWHQPLVEELPEDFVPVIGPLAEELWKSSRRLVVDDFLAPNTQSRRDEVFHGFTDARAVIMVPIGLGERVIGVIYVVTVHRPRMWTEPEINMVQQAAAFVAQIVVEHEYWVHQNEHIERLERLERQQTNFVATVS
ncbi:MAG: GAF domain-containing protein, partial [Actinomycetota bacterium]